MAALPSVPRRRQPPAVAWILLLAVLVGLAAALLSRPLEPTAPGAPSLGQLTSAQAGDIIAVSLFACLGVWLFLTLRDTRSPFPPKIVATVLLALLLGVLFVIIAGVVQYPDRMSPGNGTGGGPSPGGPGMGVPTNGTPPLLGLPRLTLPAWAGAAALLGFALLAGVLLVPYLVARVEARRRARGESDTGITDGAQRAIEETLARLRSGDGDDPRAAILALYSRLLQLVTPRLGSVESRTPWEIEQDSIRQLGLRPGVATGLTRVFEEARYSSHPMTPEALDRARASLTEAVSDLARNTGAGT